MFQLELVFEIELTFEWIGIRSAVLILMLVTYNLFYLIVEVTRVLLL